MVRVTGTPAVSWYLDSVALRTLLVVAMVLVWTHPVCQCPSAALRRSRTPDRWRLRKHWRRSSPFPVFVVVSCAGPVGGCPTLPPWLLALRGQWRPDRSYLPDQ